MSSSFQGFSHLIVYVNNTEPIIIRGTASIHNHGGNPKLGSASEDNVGGTCSCSNTSCKKYGASFDRLPANLAQPVGHLIGGVTAILSRPENFGLRI